MRPVIYLVSRVSDHWEVRCRSDPGVGDHPDRASAIAAAQRAAEAMWQEQHVATEVVVDDEDGRWHPIARFGSLLG
ncbi:MAG: hypothetical protein ACTHKZ_06365 [Lysobacteraceae bacterium]